MTASALAATAATLGADDLDDALDDADEAPAEVDGGDEADGEDHGLADLSAVAETDTSEESAAEESAAEEPAVEESAVEESAAEESAAEEPAADAPTPSDVDPLPLREQSLAGVRPGMLRRLKRALQDVQNGALDALRQGGDRPEVDELIPSDDDLAPLGAVGQMFLTAAYRAGIADGGILVDREIGDDIGDESRVPAASATFRAVISHEITSALRATLRAGVEAGEPETSLSERVGEVFRDLKGPVIEQAVDQHLSRVYGHGQLDVWSHLGVRETAWIAGAEPRCPANQCRLNEQEGAVAIGAEYPSGDAVPPAHDGCTCGLAPR